MTDRQLQKINDSASSHLTIDLWDRMNDNSIINKVPPALQNHFLEASKKRPDLFGMDERDLFKKLRAEELTPSPTDNRLRIQFWLEYDRSMTTMKRMEIMNVTAGVCSNQYFRERFLHRPEKVAWLLACPVSYTRKIEEALDFGLDRLRDMLELSVTDAQGKLNLKLMELQAKIVALLDQRVKGSVVQRIEQKNMNLNVTTSDKSVAEALTGSTMEKLDRKLKELEARERKALNANHGAIEVEIESEVVPPTPEGAPLK